MMYPNWQQGMARPGYSNRIRPVTSVEEVKASPIDFDGSVFYFHDLANKKIYTKQINLDGMVLIEAYALTPLSQPEEPAYVTKDEFQQAIQAILTKMKGENSNEQPVSNDAVFNF